MISYVKTKDKNIYLKDPIKASCRDKYHHSVGKIKKKVLKKTYLILNMFTFKIDFLSHVYSNLEQNN